MSQNVTVTKQPHHMHLHTGGGSSQNPRTWGAWTTYCGSGIFIPDPRSEFFPSRIPDPVSRVKEILGSWIRIRIRIKDFKYFNP